MITDMTEGKPFHVLWRFTIPMLVSVMFQQFYNIVDSIVAGKFVEWMHWQQWGHRTLLP